MNLKWIILLISILLSLACSPVPEESINVYYPESTTEWLYLEENTHITVNGGSWYDDERLFEIYRDGTYLGIYLDWTSTNPDDPTRVEPLDSTWTPGFGYKIKVIDPDENWGWSDPFSIVEEETSITVSFPDNNTEWGYEEESTFVEWTGATGSEIRFDLYRNEIYEGEYLGWTDNNGSAVREEALNEYWAPCLWYSEGHNYQIKAVDSDGNYGWSDSFGIVGTIVLSYPEESTEWLYQQENTHVAWTVAGESQIRFDIMQNSSYVGEYLPWTDNNDTAVRNEPLDEDWVPGIYQIRAKNFSDRNMGYSESFSIVEN